MEHGGDGWLGYDRRFLQRAALTPDVSWLTMDSTLWNIAFSGQAKTSRCKFCFSLSHESDDCDWAPTPKRSFVKLHIKQNSSHIHKREQPLSHVELQPCPYRAQCCYQHVCLLCGANHKLTTCSLQKGKHKTQQLLTPTSIFTNHRLSNSNNAIPLTSPQLNNNSNTTTLTDAEKH